MGDASRASPPYVRVCTQYILPENTNFPFSLNVLHKCRNRHFLRGAEDILHKFSPNLTGKCLCDKRSPYKFSVAVHHIFHYHVAIDLKIENFVSCNLVRYRLCKNIVRKQLAQYSWASGSQFWGFPFTLQLLLSERNLRPSWGGPEAAYFSEDVYLIEVACIIIFILWLCRESHNIICSTAHVCNKQHVFIQTLV